MTAPGAEELRLNPDAAHPPFPWKVALPATWALLDTDPATWQRSLQRLVDNRLAGRRLSAAGRRELLSHLEDLVVSAQRGGVLISLVHIAATAGGPVSAGLHLAWYDSSPDKASLATARLAAGRQGTIDEVETPAGPVIVQTDRVMMTPPGSIVRQGLTSLQAFLPLTGRTWTVLVATASAHTETTDMLRDLVVEVAGSIAPLDGGPGSVDEPVDEDDASPGRHRATGTPEAAEEPAAPADYAPTATPEAPGVDRGFGTMVVRRVGPEAGSAVADSAVADTDAGNDPGPAA